MARLMSNSIAVSVMYWFIGASIAELSSAVPSAGGVYHWASLTASPRYSRVTGWFAGYWNAIAWIFGCASMSSVLANQLISMYGLFRPEYEYQHWHVFIAYIFMTWISCGFVMFGNRLLPASNTIGMVLSIGGVFVSILVCAIMPSTTGTGHATKEFVWKIFDNETGWSSNGFVFLAGMLNGAFAVGTTDCVTHMAEEIPNPGRTIPKAIFIQCLIGFVTTVCYLTSLFYSISDLDAVYESALPFPLAEIYSQATSSNRGALGLLIVIFLPSVSCAIACNLTAGRTIWSLARDNATPFSSTFAHVSPYWQNPFNATILVGICTTILGAIQVGSLTAFNAFVGSYVVLSTLSYVAAILPNMLTKRSRLAPGPFHMRGILGYLVNGISEYC
jgi:choline transport protein